MITETKLNDHQLIIFEKDNIRLKILPELGGKIIELTNTDTGTNFLLPSQLGENIYKVPEFGEPFEEYDTSGFDECFPNVSPSIIVVNKEEKKLPDHGSLWNRPWGYRKEADSVVLSIEGKVLGYNFVKRINIEGSTVIIDYSLKNELKSPFNYIWSPHPLLTAVEDSEIILPPEVEEVTIDSTSDNSLGRHGDKLLWPKLDFLNDYSTVQPKDFGIAVKIFTDKLNNGKCGYYRSDKNETILYHFDTQKTPYLGIWLCYGGWPQKKSAKHYTIALEPTNGKPDSLETAIEQDECGFIEGGEIQSWQLKIELQKGKADL